MVGLQQTQSPAQGAQVASIVGMSRAEQAEEFVNALGEMVELMHSGSTVAQLLDCQKTLRSGHGNRAGQPATKFIFVPIEFFGFNVT